MACTVPFASGAPPFLSKSGFKASNRRMPVRIRSELGRRSDRAATVSVDEKGTEQESPGLELFYDDGYGTASVTDYFDAAKDMIRPDGGPPRWFCPVECGAPLKGSPVLLFLPGMDGVGLGLILHHKSLGKVFEVRCMHIPVYDRTPFEVLVEFVENMVRLEHEASPQKPIYLIGDSFGGCLALAVAARNPGIDLMLILSNPGDPVKMGIATIGSGLSPSEIVGQLLRNFTSMLPHLLGFTEILPKETLLWKIKQLKSAASYANSCLHAVKAEVLVLASGKDNMLPSRDEAERLWNTLPNCKVRYFKDNSHTLLLEDGIHLLTILKGAIMCRRSRRHDYVLDYLPPSMTEFNEVLNQNKYMDVRWVSLITNPVVLSTLENGDIVRGLAGVPDVGPILLIGYHMLMALEMVALVESFLREKNVMIRGLAHPILFGRKMESSLQEFGYLDIMKVFGALPASASNFYQLFSSKSFVLLYPGGARESLHRKGEEYKLIWPDQPEFVRMAARFGATIVPFGVVGEDDVAELVLDYDDQMSIPYTRQLIKDINEGATQLRADMTGEIANQDLYVPGILPKIPGRFYYLFGKPIETKERMEMLRDREQANALYLQIKSEVESIMSYLKRKREEDPYRSIFHRTIYQAIWGLRNQIPTFDP